MQNSARRKAIGEPNPAPAKSSVAVVASALPPEPYRRPASPPVASIFDQLADSVLLDDVQVGEVTGHGWETVKSWRKRGLGPRFVLVHGRPRVSAGDLRKWLAELPRATI